MSRVTEIRSTLTDYDKQGVKARVIDARPVKQFGEDLSLAILNAVANTPFGQALPNRLILSHRQFISLSDYLQLAADEFSTVGRIFLTPLNAMDVEVDETLDHVDLLGLTTGDNWDEVDG